MKFLISFFNILLPVFYLALACLYGIYFFRWDRRAKQYMTSFLRMIIIIHLTQIILRGIYYQHFPIANVYEAATVLALAIALIYLYIESHIQVKTTGFFILIIVSGLQLFSSVFTRSVHSIPDILQNPLFIFHTSAAILSYSALIISATYGLMYLLLFHNLKSAQFGVIYNRLPSLEILNEMNTKAATLGFVFLSAAILLGIIWWKSLYPDAYHFDPKVVVAYIIWINYGLIIYGKKIGGWAGKRLAYLSVSGFMVILFSIIAVDLFLSTFHRFK